MIANDISLSGGIWTYRVPIGLRRLATAEVAESPRGIAKHAQLPAIVDQVEKGTEGTGVQHEVTALRAVTSNVTESPDGLLTDIGLGAAQKLAEDRHSTSFDDHLSLLGRSGGNVGQSPGGFELNQSVRGPEELDEAADNAGLDDALDGRVALLGKQLPEFGRSLDLRFDLFGEDTLDHLGQFHVKLSNEMLATFNSHNLVHMLK